MKRNMHLDDLLSKWAFDPSTLNVRLVKGNDGRDVIQMRVDMGVLQLETTGRPDGELAHDHQSMLEFLQDESLKDADRDLTEAECMEVDREFMQFYHRRICWLRLQYYHRAVMDADHTLQLMDVSEKMSKEEVKYIVFAEDSTAMMQESLIQQSNPLTKERAIEFAERIKDRDNLFCVTIMKRVSQEELNQIYNILLTHLK